MTHTSQCVELGASACQEVLGGIVIKVPSASGQIAPPAGNPVEARREVGAAAVRIPASGP